METTRRHYEYIIHYEMQIARECGKVRPRQLFIASCRRMINHSRERLAVIGNTPD